LFCGFCYAMFCSLSLSVFIVGFRSTSGLHSIRVMTELSDCKCGLCLNVCIFVHRVYRMVEVLSAHLQDVYTKWENSSEPRLLNQTNTHHLSYGQLRRHGYRDRHRKRALARDVTREVRVQTLLTWFYRSVIENLENLHSSDVGVRRKICPCVSLHACQSPQRLP